MAVCAFCDREMLTADGCTAPYLHAHRFGSEPRFVAEPAEPTDRCRDCGALVGFHHHLNCLHSFCSVCGDQAPMCEHNVDLDGVWPVS